jgi:hypothetical protein
MALTHCCKQQTDRLPQGNLPRIRSRKSVLALHGNVDELDHSVITDLDKGGKNGGEQINIPLRARLNGQGVGRGTLRGNEESLDNQGTRFWIDWTRNAVTIDNAEEQKSSIDLFAEAKPALVDWGQEKQRDEIVDGFYAVPSQAGRRRASARRTASASTACCSMRQPLPSATPGSRTMPTAS